MSEELDAVIFSGAAAMAVLDSETNGEATHDELLRAALTAMGLMPELEQRYDDASYLFEDPDPQPVPADWIAGLGRIRVSEESTPTVDDSDEVTEAMVETALKVYHQKHWQPNMSVFAERANMRAALEAALREMS